MRIPPKTFHLLLTFVCLLLPAAAVTEEDLMRPAEMESRDVSDFPVMSSPNDLGFMLLVPAAIEEDLFVYQNGDYRKLQPAIESLSSTHYYSGSSPLTFFREGVDEEGQPIFLPVVATEFSSGTRDAVIYLHKRGDQYSSFLVDLSLRAQRLGSARFINLTPANLMVLLSNERSNLSPGQALITHFGAAEKVHFNFKVAARYEDEARVIFSNRYPFRGEMRILFIGYATGGALREKVPSVWSVIATVVLT